MQALDAYNSGGGDGGAPKGSRLAKYMGSSRAGSSTSTSTMHANVPSFVPQYAKMTINEGTHIPNGGISYNHSGFVPNSTTSNGIGSSSVDSFGHYQQELQGGTTYFYTNADGSRVEQFDDDRTTSEAFLNTNGCFAFQQPLPHIGKFRPKGPPGNNVAQFISPDLKLELVNRQLAMEQKPDIPLYKDIPQHVEHLQNLVPLESPTPGAPTMVYRAISVRDGIAYCVRRIPNFRIQSPKQLQPMDSWRKLVNINVVQLREVIPHTKAFGDGSVCLLYEYFPLAETLKTRHFLRNSFMDNGGVKSHTQGGVVENLLWSYIIQISGALRAIHGSGLAARSIDASKILITSKYKIVLGSCGIADITNPDQQGIQQQQIEDLHALGRLLLALATGNIHAGRRDLVNNSIQHVGNSYSQDMNNLIKFLLTPAPNGRKSINEIMPMIGARFYAHIEAAQVRNDMLETELSKELENGRLFRLLCKLNTIVDRAELNMDPSWSETGDRYLIKLLRDYIFHQVTESGKPWMDMAHMINCMNKLDAGVPEKIELVSRDGDNLIIVSYADLKRCVESSFRDLNNSASTSVQRQ